LDGERISLRLEAEDLELIDDFVGKRPEFSNRSHLARMAIRSFIELDGGAPVRSSENRVSIKVPGAIHSMIERMVEMGYYTSFEAAVEEVLRKEFLPREKMEDVKGKIFDEEKKILERM
jgi:Arc/MetJ-type ribon-helix-helix transcriptional regulator